MIKRLVNFNANENRRVSDPAAFFNVCLSNCLLLSFFDSFNSGLSSFLNSTFYSFSSLGSSLLGSLVSLELASEDSIELLLEGLGISLFDSSNTEFGQNSGSVLCVQKGVNHSFLDGSFFNNLSGFLSVTASCEHGSCNKHKCNFLHFFSFF